MNTSMRIVSLYYDIPISTNQLLQLTLHLPSGFQDGLVKPTDFPDRRVGESAEILSLNLGTDELPVIAELASGGWEYVLESEPAIASGDRWAIVSWTVRWSQGPEWQTLRWRHNNALFELTLFPQRGADLTGTQLLEVEYLIEIAKTMIQQGQIPLIDP